MKLTYQGHPVLAAANPIVTSPSAMAGPTVETVTRSAAQAAKRRKRSSLGIFESPQCLVSNKAARPTKRPKGPPKPSETLIDNPTLHGRCTRTQPRQRREPVGRPKTILLES